jgi:tetratricopeptide (TPR) repeat protein
MWPVIGKSLIFVVDAICYWFTVAGVIYAYRSNVFKRSDSKQAALRRIFKKAGLEAALIVTVITMVTAAMRVLIDWKEKREPKIATELIIEYRKQHGIPDIPDNKTEASNWAQDFIDRIMALERFEKAGIPLYPESYFEVGRSYAAQSKYIEAIEKLKMAVMLRPDFAEAHYLLGLSYHRTNQSELALQQCDQVTKLANNDEHLLGLALHIQGAAYRRQNKLDDAQASLTQSLEMCQGKDSKLEAIVRNTLGLVYLAKNNLPMAKELLDTALSLHRLANDPDGEATTLRSIGNYYLTDRNDARNDDNALSCYEQALTIANRERINDLKDELLHNMGIAYYNKKMMEKAEEYYQKEFEIPEADFSPIAEASALNSIGKIHEFNGDYRGSLNFYLRALQIYTATDSWDFKVPSLLSKPNADEKKTGSARTGVLRSLSYAYYKLSDFENATFYAKQILDIDPHDPAILYNLACFYSLRNDKEQALNWLSNGRRWFKDEDVKNAKTDMDLANIRRDPRFKQIIDMQK